MADATALEFQREFERVHKEGEELSRKVSALLEASQQAETPAATQEIEAEEQAAEETGLPEEEEPSSQANGFAENVIPWPSQPEREETPLPYGFRYAHDGSVERITSTRRVEENKVRLTWGFLCSPIEFLATTGNADDKAPGVLVRILSDSGRWHRLALPRSGLIGGDDLLRELADHGLRFNPSGKDATELKRLLMNVAPSGRARCVPHVGWHEDAFVLPDEILGQPPDQQIVFQPPHVIDHHYRVAGTFDGWRSEVAARALGNSRLEFSISVALTGPLLRLAGHDSGGFHWRGPSSSGKTTSLSVSGSVWGGGGISGFVRSWRTTDNALEGMALAHSDAFLPLDEIAEVDPQAVYRGAYMLSNGQGKNRANKSGALRPNYEWRTVFLSTGEIGLSSKIAENGRRSTAGQEVRVIDIPADAGKGMGLFENLHGLDRPDLFADALKDATRRHYGHAARAFIAEIVKDVPGITGKTKQAIAGVVSRICPADADSQVRRVAHKFALVACAGELAISCGILPWPATTAYKAAERCFKDWLRSRGGTGQKEENDALDAVLSFIARHGSRFRPWDKPEVLIHDCAGFYRNGDGANTFYVLKNVFRDEICSKNGVDHEYAADILAERGLLIKSLEGKRTRPERLPGLGHQRVYVIKPKGGKESEGGAE